MSKKYSQILQTGFPFLDVALVALVALGGCTARNARDQNLQVLHATLGDDMKSVDPAVPYDEISLEVGSQVYETLYQYDYLSPTYRLVPLLAADQPKISPDRLTITIPLRTDVNFQDDPCFKATGGKGRRLVARDFVYSWKRLAQSKIQSQGWWIFAGRVAGMDAFHEKIKSFTKDEAAKALQESVEGLQAVDDHTLRIKLVHPYPQLLYALAMNFTAPVPAEAVETYADETGAMQGKMVGTGPFMLEEWKRGHQVFLKRNPTFHPEFYPSHGSVSFRAQGLLADAGKTLPFLDRIEFRIIKESQPAWLGFLNGDFDSLGIPKDNFAQAIRNRNELAPELLAKGMALTIEPSATFWFLAFNMKDSLLGKNKLLRQAISSAVNREAWIDVFTNGRGLKMTSALPPGVADRPVDPKLKYDFDLVRAKSLLKKAGFPEGRRLPVFKFDFRGADSLNRQLGEFFQKQLSAIGVKIIPTYNSFPAYLDKAKNGNLQLFVGGWTMDYPDAENVYQLLSSRNASPGPNETSYASAAFDTIYNKMAVLPAGPARAKLIAQLDDIIQEDVPWALGYNSTAYGLRQPWLKNYRYIQMMQNNFKYFRIDLAEKNRREKK